MRDLQVLREVQARQARLAQGLNPYGPRTYPRQINAGPLEAEILVLPVEVDGREPIQTTTGGFMFMLGFSSLDGPDGLA